jgi:hypothetical protein
MIKPHKMAEWLQVPTMSACSMPSPRSIQGCNLCEGYGREQKQSYHSGT